MQMHPLSYVAAQNVSHLNVQSIRSTAQLSVFRHIQRSCSDNLEQIHSPVLSKVTFKLKLLEGLNFAGSSMKESNIRAHPVTGSSFLQSMTPTQPASVETRNVVSAYEHPVAGPSIMDSTLIDTMQSAQGNPIDYQGSDILDSNNSMQGASGMHRSLWESAHDVHALRPASQPTHDTMDSNMLSTARGHGMEESDDESMESASSAHSAQESLRGHPITQTNGSMQQSEDSSKRRFPRITDDSIVASGLYTSEPATAHGRPETSSGDSLVESRPQASAQGHPITFSGTSMMDSGIPESTRSGATGRAGSATGRVC